MVHQRRSLLEPRRKVEKRGSRSIRGEGVSGLIKSQDRTFLFGLAYRGGGPFTKKSARSRV